MQVLKNAILLFYPPVQKLTLSSNGWHNVVENLIDYS